MIRLRRQPRGLGDLDRLRRQVDRALGPAPLPTDRNRGHAWARKANTAANQAAIDAEHGRFKRADQALARADRMLAKARPLLPADDPIVLDAARLVARIASFVSRAAAAAAAAPRDPFVGYVVESYTGDGDVRFSQVHPQREHAIAEARAMTRDVERGAVGPAYRDVGVRVRSPSGEVIYNVPPPRASA